MDEPQIPHFMPGGAGGVMKMSEEEQNEQSLKVTKAIANMDDELKGRFKALYILQETCKDFDEEEQKEIRKLELEYENKYKMIYAQRERIINSKDPLSAEMISAFDERAVEMKDADYDKLEINPCDVKSIMNGQGVSDFWIKAILSHGIGATVTEKDRPILGNLINIELNLHDESLGKGYDLHFTFDNNSYFTTENDRNTDKTTTISKSIMMKQEGMPDEIKSTKIDWKQPSCDPTKKMKQKKKKGKKVKVEVQCDSFFNFFRNIDPTDEEAIKKAEDSKPPKEDDEDEGFEDGGVDQQMQDDLDESDQFKDDLVPLALEYYLGVIEQPDPEDDEDDEGDDGSDGDDAPKPKKGKKGGADAGAAAGGAEGQDKDCKQQ